MTEELKAAPVWANVVASITRRMPMGKHRLIEGLFSKSNQRFVGAMVAELGGYRFDCCLRDRVARSIFFAGYHAMQEMRFVRLVLQPGMTFVDVGSNWGVFTLLAAHLVGDTGRVVALEPDPRIFAKLKSNVERNHLKQVAPVETAAADSDSILTLAAHDHTTENWEISRLVESAPIQQPVFKVKARKLDGLLDEAGIGDVDLLKMDVEGAEDMALTGMEAGLAKQRYRRILLELHPPQLAERGKTVGDVVALLTAQGYKGYGLDYTESGMRKAYYHPWAHGSEFILPLDHALANQMRHTLWVSPEASAIPQYEP